MSSLPRRKQIGVGTAEQPSERQDAGDVPDGADRSLTGRVARRRLAAVVVAAGRGERLGPAAGGRPKALVEIAGRPLVSLAVDGLRAAVELDELVVVHPAGLRAAFRAVLDGPVCLVVGGPRRLDSVQAGVTALTSDAALIAVHDAARPLVPPQVVVATVDAVTGDVVAAAPGLPVGDTLKRASADGRVLGTVDRRGLWAAHTPQVIRSDVLRLVLSAVRSSTLEQGAASPTITDDLGLIERAAAAGLVDGRTVLIEGNPRDLKVTYPADLSVVRALLAGGC